MANLDGEFARLCYDAESLHRASWCQECHAMPGRKIYEYDLSRMLVYPINVHLIYVPYFGIYMQNGDVNSLFTEILRVGDGLASAVRPNIFLGYRVKYQS